MIEKNWHDLVCYNIHFKNNEGINFYRNIVLPINFPEEKIPIFFKKHFAENPIIIVDVSEMHDIWISKHAYSPFMEDTESST